MLKRVKVTGYKSLKDLEVELQPLSVLFGPNAAGKSNFLDALQLLSKLVTSRTLKEAFAPPYRGKPLESFSFGAEGIRGLLKKESCTFSIEADVELSPAVIETVNRQILEMKRTGGEDPGAAQVESKRKKLPSVRETYLRYRIEIEILPKKGFLRVVDEYLAALNQEGRPTVANGSRFCHAKGRRCICGWKVKRTPRITTGIWITQSCLCLTILRTTRILWRCARNWNGGSSSISSPGNACGRPIRSKRCSISV